VPGLAAAAWNVLSTAGGALALTFIVALALGIGALTLFFFGSSVVVLQGFARRARRVWPVAATVAVLALVAGGLAASSEETREALDPSVSPLVLWAALSLAAAVGIAALAGASHVVLRRLAPDTLARGSLLVLGLGYALVVGGSARVAYAAAPAVACGLAALAARGLRRRRGGPAGEVEPAMRDLAGVLALGAALALALPRPRDELAAAGGLLLQLFLLAVVLGLLPLAVGGFLDTRRSAEWFIAVRYLVAKRRQTFISIISLICAGGVAAGVWLIITVLSVMNGFQQVWREEIVGKRAHLTVQSRQGSFGDWREVLDRVLAEPEVIGAAPYLDAEGMVRGGRGQIVGVRIRGVDPERVGQVTTLEQDLIEGALADLATPAAPAAAEPPPAAEGDGAEPPEPALPGIAIGSELAFGLGLAVGDPILLVSPFGGPPTPFGPAPRLHRFRVAAIFRSTFFQAEEMVTYVTLPAAQEFLRSEGDVVNGIEVRVRDVYRSRRVALSLQAGLGDPFYARDWKEFFPAFFQALKTEQVMMFVLLTMIMVVAAFVIVATLIMMIMEKSSDIAILKAMGAEDATIERIFAIEGTLIGLAGTAIGVAAGIVVTTQLAWIQRQVETLTGIDTLPASVYQFSTLPWRIDPIQVIGVAAIAMVLALGATLLPSRQGARLDPAESLRYE
jgi:lipoprotein-releasing system permease protein